MKKQYQNDQITRMIERENVITFKRKTDGKGSVKSQKDQDDDLESAKSHPSEEPSFSKPSKKSIPLPQLNKQRKRLIIRSMLPQTKSQSNSNYLEKEVRQQDNLMLKNMNNHVSNENMKLKTKNMNLEKQIVRLQKQLEDDPQKNKLISSKDIKGRYNESNSLKIALRNMQKELEEVKKQNTKIKISIKFTTISELQVERDSILQQSGRLRQMIEEERNKIMFLRANQHGISAMEQKLMHLQEKNHYLSKQNNNLKGKVIKSDDRDKLSSKASDSQKNLNKMLYNTRRLLKEKERQLDMLKNRISKQESNKVLQVSSGLQNSRVREVQSQFTNKVERQDKLKTMKQRKVMSKSAQKYRSNVAAHEKDECKSCIKLKDENVVLNTQVQRLKADLDQAKMNKSPVGELSKIPISIPSKQQVQQLQRFLLHRFRAHHLTLQQASFHLINFEGKTDNLDKQISIAQILELVMAEPFSILSDRYIQSFIIFTCYNGDMTSSSLQGAKVTIQQGKMLTRVEVQHNFKTLIGEYELLGQVKQEQMFIQIAELVTQYQQHILKALNQKRNSQNTIPQKDFYEFFKEIELEKDYIDFMVSQIILQSLDLDHLNIYNLFQIFYMPPQEQMPVVQSMHPPHKKKFNIIDVVVKEEDEEYEESKSFLDKSRQKSMGKQEHEQEHEMVEQQEGQGIEKEGVVEDYQEHFQQQKMENPQEQQKANEQIEQKPNEHEHYNIQNIEQQYIDDYQT